MAVSLLQEMQAGLTPHLVRGAAAWLGEAPQATDKALGAAHVAVLQGLLQASRDPARRDDLLRIISDRGNDRWLLSSLGSLFQGRLTTERASLGNRFLGLLFGDRTGNISRRIAEVSGVAPASATNILATAGPHVLATLGERLRRSGNFSTQGLSSLLESESSGIAAGQRPEWGDLIGVQAGRGAAGVAAGAAAAQAVSGGGRSVQSDRGEGDVRHARTRDDSARMSDDEAPMTGRGKRRWRWGRREREVYEAAPGAIGADVERENRDRGAWTGTRTERPAAVQEHATVARSGGDEPSYTAEPRGIGLGAIFLPLAALLVGWGLWSALSSRSPVKPTTTAVAPAPAPAAKPVVEAVAPVAKAPEVKTAEVKAPEVKVPEAKAPEVKAEAPAAAPAPVETKVAAEPVPGVTTFLNGSGVAVPGEAVMNPDYVVVAAAAAAPAAVVAQDPAVPPAEPAPGVTTFLNGSGAAVPGEAVMNPEYVVAQAPAAPVVAEAPAAPPAEPAPGVTSFLNGSGAAVPAEAVMNPDYVVVAKAPPPPAPAPKTVVAQAPPPAPREPGVTSFFGTGGAVTVPTEAIMMFQVQQSPPAAAPARVATVKVCQDKVNAAANSGPIRFRTAKADLTNESEDALQRLVAAIKACPGVRVRVEGHTDNVGQPERNQRLSEARARRVADFLTANGLADGSVSAVGFGDARPVAPNDTPENKAKNRRINFIVEDGAS